MIDENMFMDLRNNDLDICLIKVAIKYSKINMMLTRVRNRCYFKIFGNVLLYFVINKLLKHSPPNKEIIQVRFGISVIAAYYMEYKVYFSLARVNISNTNLLF